MDATEPLKISEYKDHICALFKGKVRSHNESKLSLNLNMFETMKSIEAKYGRPPISGWSRAKKTKFIIANSEEYTRIFGEVRDATTELNSRSIFEVDYLCYRTYYDMMEKLKKVITNFPYHKISITMKHD